MQTNLSKEDQEYIFDKW